MVSERDITTIEVVSYIVFFAVLAGYFTISLLPNIQKRYRTISFFWTDPPTGGKPASYRWPWVILSTETIVGIQSLRCTIQGGTYFGKTAMLIAFVFIFFEVESRRQHVLYLFISIVAVASTVFAVQMMRMTYQLDYLIMSVPKKKEEEPAKAVAVPALMTTVPREPESGKNTDLVSIAQAETQQKEQSGSSQQELAQTQGSITPTTPSLSPSAAGGSASTNNKLKRRRINDHILAHVADEQLASRSVLDTQAKTLLAVEEDLSKTELTERLERIMQRANINFALSIRTMLFIIPLVIGLYHPVALIAATALLVPVLLYFDTLMG